MIYDTTETGKACPAVKYGNASISTVQIHTNKGDGVCSFCAMFESSPPVKYHTGPSEPSEETSFLSQSSLYHSCYPETKRVFSFKIADDLDGRVSNSTKITSSNTDAQMEVSYGFLK